MFRFDALTQTLSLDQLRFTLFGLPQFHLPGSSNRTGNDKINP